MDLIDRLVEHDRWATTQLLEASRGLTDAQLDQSFDIGHRTLRETFDHMIFNTAFWTGLMAGQSVESDRDARSLSVLIERAERAYELFATIAGQARDEQRLNETFTDHFGLPTSFGGTIIHVAMHNAEHRSEVLHILQRLGVSEVEEVDHLLWEHVTKGH